MKRRLAVLSFTIIALAVPAFARVLSYAPYSNRTSLAGFHDRTTRHFVLIEAMDDSNWWQQHQLVLYDTKGIKEPRVVFPMGGGTSNIQAAALYEPKESGAAPVLLVSAYQADGQLYTYLSPDGGETWIEIGELRGKYLVSTSENDFGGPHVQGMTNPVRNLTDHFPFIVNVGYHGVFALRINGQIVPLVEDPFTTVIGQDRTATRLLLRTQSAIEILDLNAPLAISRKTLAPVQSGVRYSGWITGDGSAYIQATSSLGRFLFFHHNNQAQFIAGPYDVTPPSLGTPWPAGPWTDLMRFFAVPSHDYEGAWLLQRQPGRATTLSRHTRPQGLQQQWSDVSGPEVEALIAGNSGNTLLIQVHRDRSVELQRPFIDPALAVWKVGDPMPRHYDELYLNEEWNKGFVHVDVDKMAEGEPFVFNSGAFRNDVDIIVSPAPGGGGDVIQEWGVVRASLKQHLVLPGVARLHGAFDSRWLTDVTIYNPLQVAQNVDVRFIGLGQDVQTAALHQQTVTLQPGQIRFIPDVLHSLFAIADGGGALHFIPESGINVVGRTYSHKGEGGGTFGFGMQAIDFFNAAGPRFPVTFAGAFPGQHFRTNVLLTDTSGRGTAATLGAFGVSGSIGATEITIDAPPGGILQFNGIGGTLDLFSRDAGGLVIQPTRGTAIATVVAIDNRTNDPTYFPPDLPASDQIRVIPVIGHLDGANGSRFRSDIYLFNPTSETSTVTLEAKQWDSAGMKMVSFTLLPREARTVADALPTLFDMTGLARLRYWSNTFGDGVRVTSRTYTVEDSGATYGSLIPPLNNFQMAAPGDHLEILGVTGGSGFRTNLGLVELSPSTIAGPEASVRIRVLDQNLHELDSFSIKVPRAGGMQINDIFGSRGVTPPEAAMLIVQVESGGLIGAYATLVDNITNDTTFLGAQLGAQPN
ncbi:MAG: hypothetical protein M3P06_07685 [Acidobacteriota bacterium]|nr:hypothetical protein [Acidobacteriota bacterium]